MGVAIVGCGVRGAAYAAAAQRCDEREREARSVSANQVVEPLSLFDAQAGQSGADVFPARVRRHCLDRFRGHVHGRMAAQELDLLPSIGIF